MKALLLSYGTRGDCEPFLGVGELLRARGIEVIAAFPEQYRGLAEESGFAFRTLGSAFLDRLGSEDMKAVLGGRGPRRLAAFVRVAKDGLALQREMIETQRAVLAETDPDLVLHHAKCAYVLPWAMRHGRRAVLFALQPGLLHEVKGLPHVGLPAWLPASWTYALMQRGYAKTAKAAADRGLGGGFTARELERAILAEPVLVNVSPAVFPRPPEWPAHVKLAGFWQRDQATAWSPPAALSDFLARHERVLFVTFGSMTNPDPAGATACLLDVLAARGIPAVIGYGGGGLVALEDHRGADVLFVDQLPYDAALPSFAAVIHHGGAGTTHSALRAGCATMAIPHAVDQPMWDAIIAARGAGPRGLPVARLTREGLAAKVAALWDEPRYRAAAEEIGRRMRAEDHDDEVFAFLVDGTGASR